jgi:motility quorum-sensing regulator / GCU-specific mRNA interferase toxin
MAEKRTAHHDLDAIKQAFSSGEGRYTKTAIRDAAALGYASEDINAVIRAMTKRHIYKSMTANLDAKIWQDVYHVLHDGMNLYIKFTDNGSATDFTLLSFKER